MRNFIFGFILGLLCIGSVAYASDIKRAGNRVQTLVFSGQTFANLGTPGNGTLSFCTDCTSVGTCASGGAGALAKRINGGWICN